jgi:hypothetical protein
MVKKDLTTAVLLTFCLTAVLLTITPTRSAPETGNYDPWCDVNDDGLINIFDVVAITSRYGKTGTPINKTALLGNETWHFVTNFTLSEYSVSPQFLVYGEKWRVRWEPHPVQSSSGFAIWDENGYCIDYVDIGKILMYYHDAKGIHYVPNGNERCQIELFQGANVSFTIESYY